MWDPSSSPGVEPTSPALLGEFLTTEQPEKSLDHLFLKLKDWDQVLSFHEWDLGPWDLPHLPTWLSRGAGYRAHVYLLPPKPAGASFRLSFSPKSPMSVPLPFWGLSHPWPNLTALITNDPSKGHSPSVGKARTTEQGVLDYSARSLRTWIISSWKNKIVYFKMLHSLVQSNSMDTYTYCKGVGRYRG